MKWFKRIIDAFTSPENRTPLADWELKERESNRIRVMVERKLGCGYVTQKMLDARLEALSKKDK